MALSATQLVARLNELDEHLHLEAKSGLGDSLLETICAFSNEPDLNGGIILLGVARDDKAPLPLYNVFGIEDPDRSSSTLASQCASVFNIPIRPSIRTEQINGLNVLVIEVPEAAASEKPVYFLRKGLPKGAFRRIGSSDQQCTEDDLAALFGERGEQTFDDRVLAGASAEDIDPEAIEAYRTLRRRVNPAAEELAWSDEDLLKALSAIRIEHGQVRPTLAGILLFGTRQALRRLLPTVRLDYIRVPGKEWVENPDERFSTTDMRGPLLQVVQRAQDQVFEDLPKAFVLDEGRVQARGESLPARVLREAIVNAVMHASYRVNQPIQIIRYNNRIEIRNPGYSLKNEDQLGEPGSRLRNPKLAAVFHETNLAETKGSGIRTMRRLMQEAGFAPPTFESDRANDLFTARLLLHHFLTSADLSWLAGMGDSELNDAQKRSLIFVRESGAIDNQVCRQINGVDTLAASQGLRRLRDLGFLEMRGKGAATYYVPGSRFDGKSTKVEAERHQLSPEKHQVEAERHQLPTKIQSLVDNATPYSRTENIQAAILALAGWKPLTGAELARILKRRDVKRLRRAYLTPLIEEGRLVYTIPDMPHHPRQAYTLP